MGKIRSTTLILLGLVVLCASSGMVRAQQCNTSVVDEAGALSGRLGEVEQAVQRLRNAGADAYVRIAPTFSPHPNVDAYSRSLTSVCPNLGSGLQSGAYKSTLIMIVVTIRDRGINVATGSTIDGMISVSKRTNVRVNVITPHFKNRDIPGGIIAGLDQFTDYMNAATGSSPVGRTQSVPVRPIVVPSSTPSQPMDLSGVATFFKWLAVVVLLGAGVAVFFVFRSRRRAFSSAKDEMFNVKAEVARLIADFPASLAVSQASLSTSKSLMSPAEYNLGNRDLTRISDGYNKASSDFLIHSKTEPTSTTGCQSLKEEFEDIRSVMQGLSASLGQVDTNLEELKTRAEQLPQKISDARTTADKTKQGLVNLAAKRYDTSNHTPFLTEAGNKLDAADQQCQNNKYSEAEQSLEAALRFIGMANEGLELENNRQATEKQIQDAQERVEGSRQSVDQAKVVFDGLSTEFAQASWEAIKGNGSQSVQHVLWCEAALPKAAEANSLDVQNWKLASDLLQQVNERLDTVDSLTKSIHRISTSLQKARTDAPKEIAAAERDLEAARRFEREHDADIDDAVKGRFGEAEELINQAKAELQQAKPDYFEVLKKAKRANEIADAALDQSRSEHEAAERLRRKAASALRDAKSRVSKAKRYINDHSSDVKKSARSSLESAQDYLRQAEEATNLSTIVELAELADSHGKTAYSRAEENVEAERQSRVVYDPTPSHTSVFTNNWQSSPQPETRNTGFDWTPTPSPSIGSDNSSIWDSVSTTIDTTPSVGSDNSGTW